MTDNASIDSPLPAPQLIRELLAGRGAGKTVCPSEVARSLAGPGGDWRERMTEVHEAVDTLATQGLVALSWRGTALARREGPYRIGLPE